MAAARPASETEPDARYRWYVLFILMLTYTVHYVDRSVINAVLEPIRSEFRLSDAALGLLAGPVYAAAFAIAGLPLGLLIDRTNRKKLLALLLALWSGLTFASGFATSFYVLLAARAAVGAAEAGGSPTALSILSDYFSPARRATATGIFFLSVTLGLFLGLLVSGVVAASFGWRAAFFVAGTPGLILALLLWFTVREPPRARFDEGAYIEQASLRATFATLFSCLPLGLTLLALVISATVTGGFNAFVISLLIRRYGIGLGEAAIIVSIAVGLFGGAGSVLWGYLSDRLRRRAVHFPPLLIAGTSLIATAFGLVGVLSHSLLATTLGIAGFGFFITSFMGSGYGLLLNLAPASTRGSCTAVSQVLINFIGAGFGPLVVGTLSTLLATSAAGEGLARALMIVLLLTVVGATFQLVVSRSLREQAPLPPPDQPV